MSTVQIEGGTVIGTGARVTTLTYSSITLKAPLIEVRYGSKDGALLALIDTSTGDLQNTGDRHEGARL